MGLHRASVRRFGIRFLVVLRKVTYGSRTRAGARRMGTLMTVMETAKRQGKNMLRFFGTKTTTPIRMPTVRTHTVLPAVRNGVTQAAIIGAGAPA